MRFYRERDVGQGYIRQRDMGRDISYRVILDKIYREKERIR